MADGHQINFSTRQFKTINHAVITDPQPAFIRTGHTIMLECRQPQTRGINLALNLRLDLRWQAEKIMVEFA